MSFDSAGSSAGYIHGSTDEREVKRLEKQAGFVARFSLTDFEAAPGERVLDLATGVGAMARELHRRFPGACFIGLDLRVAQLRHATKAHPVAAYVQGDGERLPFPDASFHKVHCSWLLEHVPRPVAILKEVRRVLRPGGYAHFTEVDNASFSISPPDADVSATMDALNRAQLSAGGDPYVGQKLARLFFDAGFSDVEIRPAPLDGSAAEPALFVSCVEEFAEIFLSLDESLGDGAQFRARRAAEALLRLPSTPGAAFRYRSFVAKGFA